MVYELPGSPGRRLTLYAGVAAFGRSGSVALPSAILLSILAIGGTTASGSILVAAITGVGALLGPVVGAMIDRMEHPRWGYFAGLGSLTIGAIALGLGLGSWPFGVLVIVAGLAGLGQPVLLEAWSGQLRRIVPDMPAARVYAVDVGTYNFAEIAGPALVGAVFVFDAAVPGAATLEAVVALFVIATVILIFVPIPPRAATTSEPPGPLMNTLRLIRVMIDSRSLRTSTIIGTFGYCAFAFVVISTPLLGADLAGDAGIGVFLLTLIAVGALTGTVLLARRPVTWRGPGTIAAGATVVLTVALLGIAIAPSFAWAGVFAVLFGLILSAQSTSLFRVRDRESPPHARGMVFVTSASLRVGAFAIGSVIAGALSFAGWRWLFVAAAIVEVIAVLLALVSVSGTHARMGRTTR